MVKICINKTNSLDMDIENVMEIFNHVSDTMSLNRDAFYLEQNGKRLSCAFDKEYPIHVRLCVLGGKGGFGSMLRAIGAQIEKTTNREACRDLSGRRLRDINEEKRLKVWLEKQGEREREAEERKKRKIQKLLAVPKHDFKDEEYEEARSKLTEKVCIAVEEGLKKAEASCSTLKRRNEASTSQNSIPMKRNKNALWLDDEISSSDDTDESDDENLKNRNDLSIEKPTENVCSNETLSCGSEKDKNIVCGRELNEK